MLPVIEAVEWVLLRLGVLSGFATLIVTLVVVADVAGRAIFNAPLHSATEVSELLLVVLVFLGLAGAQQKRQNYAIDVASRHLPVGLQNLLETLGYVFCLVLTAGLAWFSTKQAFSSYERGEAGFGIIAFPIWPARFILSLGVWLLSVQFVCDILRYLIGSPRTAAEGGSASGSHE
ncbi:MAG: TRAP transporter small permease [Hyphomicrobiaceae bacterium]